MLRKWIKKGLPKAELVQKNKGFYGLEKFLANAKFTQVTRHTVAKGVGAGLFAALIPLPIQMMAAAILALLCGGNILVAMMMTWLTNPFTFIPINLFIYKVGVWISHDSQAYQVVREFDWHGQSWRELIDNSMVYLQHFGKPFFIGLPFVAVGVAIIGYFLVQIIWRLGILYQIRQRLARRKNS